MSRITATALTLLLATSGCYAAKPGRGQGRPSRQPVLVSEGALAVVEDAIFEGTNRFRAEHGLPALQHDPQLRQFSRSRSQDMAARRYFSHATPDGKGVFTLMREAGIRFGFGAENIHRSTGVPVDRAAATAVQGWINSPGHRANLLAQRATLIGVGVAQAPNGSIYSTQVFSRP